MKSANEPYAVPIAARSVAVGVISTAPVGCSRGSPGTVEGVTVLVVEVAGIVVDGAFVVVDGAMVLVNGRLAEVAVWLEPVLHVARSITIPTATSGTNRSRPTLGVSTLHSRKWRRSPTPRRPCTPTPFSPARGAWEVNWFGSNRIPAQPTCYMPGSRGRRTRV